MIFGFDSKQTLDATFIFGSFVVGGLLIYKAFQPGVSFENCDKTCTKPTENPDGRLECVKENGERKDISIARAAIAGDNWSPNWGVLSLGVVTCAIALFSCVLGYSVTNSGGWGEIWTNAAQNNYTIAGVAIIGIVYAYTQGRPFSAEYFKNASGDEKCSLKDQDCFFCREKTPLDPETGKYSVSATDALHIQGVLCIWLLFLAYASFTFNTSWDSSRSLGQQNQITLLIIGTLGIGIVLSSVFWIIKNKYMTTTSKIFNLLLIIILMIGVYFFYYTAPPTKDNNNSTV